MLHFCNILLSKNKTKDRFKRLLFFLNTTLEKKPCFQNHLLRQYYWCFSIEKKVIIMLNKLLKLRSNDMLILLSICSKVFAIFSCQNIIFTCLISFMSALSIMYNPYVQFVNMNCIHLSTVNPLACKTIFYEIPLLLPDLMCP